MRVLAIETATDVVGVALADAHRVLAEAHVATGRRHGETLAALVSDTCARAWVGARELDAIAVDVGPGLPRHAGVAGYASDSDLDSDGCSSGFLDVHNNGEREWE